MNISIKKRIYISFSLLVVLFVINGIATLATLNRNHKLSENVSTVIDPSLQAMEDFEDILVELFINALNLTFRKHSKPELQTVAFVVVHAFHVGVLHKSFNSHIRKEVFGIL